MSVEIDQNVLCDACKDHHDSSMDMCEGSQCEKMKDIYLDNLGIVDEGKEDVCFKNIKLGDKLYLVQEGVPGSFVIAKCSGMVIANPRLEIHNNSSYCLTIDKDDFDKACVEKKLNSSRAFWLLKYSDAVKKYEEICTENIITLSKAIGNPPVRNLTKEK